MKFTRQVLLLLIMLTAFLVLVVGMPQTQNPKLLKRTTKPVKPSKAPRKDRERLDKTINEYMAERTCWWNEMCKEEFSTKFRCRCPLWSYCSSPGKYYNAYCTMSGTGYLWSQQPKGPGLGPLYRPPYKSRV